MKDVLVILLGIAGFVLLGAALPSMKGNGLWFAVIAAILLGLAWAMVPR